jgi:hypothetical protein
MFDMEWIGVVGLQERIGLISGHACLQCCHLEPLSLGSFGAILVDSFSIYMEYHILRKKQ